MNESQKETQTEENLPKFRGLYRYVKIPVKALDAISVICIVVILAVIAFEMINPGFTVTFDSNGGSDVPGQHQDYGDLLEVRSRPAGRATPLPDGIKILPVIYGGIWKQIPSNRI